jgi:hypothetical protein
MGLSKVPVLRHMWVKSWPGKLAAMRATMPSQPPVSSRPTMGTTRQPSQMRKNWSTSLKMADSSPPAAT